MEIGLVLNAVFPLPWKIDYGRASWKAVQAHEYPLLRPPLTTLAGASGRSGAPFPLPSSVPPFRVNHCPARPSILLPETLKY